MVWQRLWRGASQGSGAVLVEFVLVAGLVLVLLFGSIEYGLLLNARLVLEAAARDGARRAAVEGGTGEQVLERIARQLELGGIDPEKVEVDISPWWAEYGRTIRVRLAYDYPLISPVVRTLLGESVRLEVRAITRSERSR
ncbi:MAG: pilus assembly protein [Acetobacteraceae bacterium]|nr:pilus assembly protein [Acetobacteraceae bacterium]